MSSFCLAVHLTLHQCSAACVFFEENTYRDTGRHTRTDTEDQCEWHRMSRVTGSGCLVHPTPTPSLPKSPQNVCDDATAMSYVCVCVPSVARSPDPQVQAASYSLGNALRVHAAAVPENLTGHFVLIGAHPRLQYFVLGLRRRRPDAAVVVITNEEVGFI